MTTVIQRSCLVDGRITTHKHLWETVDPYDGGYHICKKCKLGSQGERLATPCPVSDAEYHAVAWLGQAGLYRTRFEAVGNFEQSVAPVTADELFNLASKQVLSQFNEGRQSAQPSSTQPNSEQQEALA
ncbi:hypothetical protein [Pseudomonas sp. HN2-3]|uniref:hypothetical protein n=1 Tax=Pseudomonas sp. HN2-3 TaxID=2886360 RepID=UPI001D1119FF|nr:hypothetical protein [Pseudomonas sp. HN2-3]UDU82886.1 hypothetical protein LJX93_08050 [Pseudomonas sp. HN2-3]